jgi:hypothetical protein
VQWPIQTRVAIPAAAKSKANRKHKFARSSEKPKQRVAHDTKPEPRAERVHRNRHERVHAGTDGHHANNNVASRVNALTAH